VPRGHPVFHLRRLSLSSIGRCRGKVKKRLIISAIPAEVGRK
jgi:hypothetical protein